MASLKTLLTCFAADQLLVKTPTGIATMLTVERYGDVTSILLDTGDGAKEYASPEDLKPILGGFHQFRAAAVRGEQFAKQALFMIGEAVAKINVGARHRYPQQALEMGLDAALNQVHPTAKGYGRISWELAPLWNPLDDPKSDPRQWQPIVVPGFDELLLSNGYAAGIPAGQWITEDGANLSTNYVGN